MPASSYSEFVEVEEVCAACQRSVAQRLVGVEEDKFPLLRHVSRLAEPMD